MRWDLFLMIRALFTVLKAVFFCACWCFFIPFVMVVTLWFLCFMLGLAKVAAFFCVEGDE